MNNVIMLVARLLLAQVFLYAGLGKIGTGYVETEGYMEAMRVPGALLPLATVLELVGGVALVAGFQTRWAALALAVYSVIAAVLFHHNVADQAEMILFSCDVAMAGGLLALHVHGAGAISVDAWWARRA